MSVTLSQALNALPEAGTPDKTIVLEGSTAKQTDYSAGGGASYLVYVALLSQTGTDAPVATVLENTLGGTVVWTRDGTGNYIGTLAGAFTADKTICLVQMDYVSFYGGVAFSRNDADSVAMYVFEISAGAGNEKDLDGAGLQIEIRVYP